MKDILKLSIILPDTRLPKQSMDLIDWCLANQQVELVCLIWTSKKNRKYIHTVEDFTWSSLLFLESLYLKIKKITKKEALQEIKKFAQPQEFTLCHNNESSITQINNLEIDLHLALNLDASISRLKDSSRLGVLCFNNENNFSDQKNPYFFSEVLSKQDKTIFSILQYQPSNELPIVLQQGAFPTHGYFLANQENVLLRQNFYMQKEIEAILQNNFDSLKPFKGAVHNDLPSAPSIANQFKYLFHLLALATKRLGELFKQVDKWNVGFYLGDWKSLDFKNSICIENPKNHFLADPFVIEEGHKNYCFVEDYDIKKSKGVIRVYEISNKEVRNIGIALEEDFHLSFPYLFKHDSKIYMLPETNNNNDIRLYESIQFPLKWQLVKIIKKNIRAVDSMIFKRDDLWWLFSNINPIGTQDTCSELLLFYTDDLLAGEWLPHGQNPIIIDPSSARNGGIIIEDKSIFRVGQNQTFGTYGGGGFSINKIIDLNKDIYQEEPVLKVKPDFFKNLKGAHHFHSSGNISAFDFLT